MDEKVRYLMPNLDRATEIKMRIKGAAGGDAVDGLRADAERSGYVLGLSGGVLFVASVYGGGRG